MTLEEILRWAQGPGINIVVGALLSGAGEYIPQYLALDPKYKRLIFGVFCLVVPLLAAFLGCSLGYQACSIEETYWPAVYAGALVAFASGTLAHTRKLTRTEQPQLVETRAMQ